MPHLSYTDFRRHLARYLEQACDGDAPVRVTRRTGRNVVLLSEAVYEGMLETLHLLRSPANAERLLRSIRSAEVGR